MKVKYDWTLKVLKEIYIETLVDVLVIGQSRPQII